ncbi:hypothetical protein JOD31_002511 [Methylopila capsulata]|uniref:Uncharacterized protein n=1 Tax=Methylopila capsulata TaxID=61654 RepID=A0A9W6ITY2_9HYPH|nr:MULTISPECIES: hypothetical protein [Methylopila]MBM7852269.1 hypothetical protein [Methylopila capsulata]GBD49484.1 hypothetical protein METY_2697 [Methylopila sp. Yamaguchi]GLK56478.1 hypothetical protein GCM10008170_24970 [Methylopila capsulata]
MAHDDSAATDEGAVDDRRAALAYLDEAWEEALLDGIAPDCVAHAALFAALKELVLSFGEEATARFVERLPDRLRKGDYTLPSLAH